MRISCIAVAIALTSTSLAVPIRRDFFGNLNGVASSFLNGNATLSGIIGTVAQSIENPQLTVARVTVVKGLIETRTSLFQIENTASATGNTGVTSLVATGQAAVASAQQGIDNITNALISGNKPSLNDQRTVAIGIKAVRTAVNQMATAITTPDSTLSSQIATGQANVQTLQNGGEGVLSASGLTFAELGLPDNFATS